MRFTKNKLDTIKFKHSEVNLEIPHENHWNCSKMNILRFSMTITCGIKIDLIMSEPQLISMHFFCSPTVFYQKEKSVCRYNTIFWNYMVQNCFPAPGYLCANIPWKFRHVDEGLKDWSEGCFYWLAVGQSPLQLLCALTNWLILLKSNSIYSFEINIIRNQLKTYWYFRFKTILNRLSSSACDSSESTSQLRTASVRFFFSDK